MKPPSSITCSVACSGQARETHWDLGRETVGTAGAVGLLHLISAAAILNDSCEAGQMTDGETQA